MLSKLLKLVGATLLAFSFPAILVACPDLRSLYPGTEADWDEIQSELDVLFEQCLSSSEYFALLGAAQLNLGEILEAIESLERALLLNPDNGAALIDYAEALFQDGQLFAALDASSLLIDRDDVPEEILNQLIERRDRWQELTQQTRWRLDLGGGYDNNLNGAPDDSQIALTLSGEPIFLNLNEEFRAASGELLNIGIAAQHTRLSPEYQDNITGSVRGRVSENRSSDLLQYNSRFSRLYSARQFSYRQGLGVTHLNFAGNALFTGTDIRSRLEFDRGLPSCDSHISTAIQHQVWHTQRRLDGVEVKAGVGGICSFRGLEGQTFGFEMNIINNFELRDDRLGGDRIGWQLLGQWQRLVFGGLVTGQAEFGSLRDEDGYSDLLENNARRRISRATALIQYQRPTQLLGFSSEFVVKLFHQEQRSNINLFDTTDSSIEIGISINF